MQISYVATFISDIAAFLITNPVVQWLAWSPLPVVDCGFGNFGPRSGQINY